VFPEDLAAWLLGPDPLAIEPRTEETMHTRRSPLLAALAATFCLAWPAGAQAPAPARLTTELQADLLRVPLQPLSPAEAAELGAGFAAAEAGYKARFVDGFELIPALGDRRAENAALRWRTRSVAIGGNELALDAAAAPRCLDSHTVIYEHAELIERYELRPAGIEQLFVLARPLDARGDLVIRGAIETPLVAAERALEHAELIFRDEAGAPVVSYGVAVAFDACGRTIAMPSAFQRGEIALHLDGEWLARASFPVTIDPLAAPVFLSGSAPNGGALSSIEIEAADGIAPRNVLVAFTRAISLSDHDVYAVLCDENFASPLLIYTNIDATYSDTDVQVAFVNRHDRWVLCSERRRVTPNGEYARLRLYSFPASSLQVNAGLELLSSLPANADHSRADLGGSVAGSYGDTALLCYQADAGPAGTLSDHSEIYVASFHAQTLVLGAAQALSATPAGTRYDREDPALNARRWGESDGWIVGWRELDRQSASDDWDVRGVRTDAFGARVQEAQLYDAGGARDVRSFQIAGIGSVYLLAATLSTTQGSSNVTGLVSRRFDWTAAASQPTVHPTRGSSRACRSRASRWRRRRSRTGRSRCSSACLRVASPRARSRSSCASAARAPSSSARRSSTSPRRAPWRRASAGLGARGTSSRSAEPPTRARSCAARGSSRLPKRARGSTAQTAPTPASPARCPTPATRTSASS
jgi:hypothetical protein